MSVFDFETYRELIGYQLENSLAKRGAKTSLAEAAGCQLSHLSQVLNGHVHVTTEQAFGMAAHWSFDEDATEFFMALVQRERSASDDLTAYLTKKIGLIRDRKKKLSEQVKTKKIIQAHDISRYYASWLYPTIHMLITIVEFQSLSALTSKLKTRQEVIIKVVADLQVMGLAKRDGSKVFPVSQNIHIESDSPSNVSFHNIWRNLANQSMQQNQQGNHIHYTSLYTMSLKDSENLRKMILNFIHETRDVVAPSHEESLWCFGCDFFEV